MEIINFTFNEKFGLHVKNNSWDHLKGIKGNTKKFPFVEYSLGMGKN